LSLINLLSDNELKGIIINKKIIGKYADNNFLKYSQMSSCYNFNYHDNAAVF
jgi:hypothetical protein